MSDESTSVLVVGGGVVGLSAALFLADRGVPTVLVERHPGSSPHPRAVGFTPRVRELYRAAGIEALLPEPLPAGPGPRRRRVTSLTGHWFEELPWNPAATTSSRVEDSPCGSVGLTQDRLEPLLRDRARARGADVRMRTTLSSLTQDGDHVRAQQRGADGVGHAVRADYLIAADGHRSPIREMLGIGRDGHGVLRTSRSVLFRADLDEHLYGFCQFMIDRPELQAGLITYGDGRWVLFLPEDADMTPAALHRSIALAVGRVDVDVDVLATGRWEVTAAIARTYQAGRILLAGDAAHTLPPNRGGFGAATGIEDAHNLAWKLAAVLDGVSAPALLDTYTDERRPVAVRCHDQIFSRPDGAGVSPTLAGRDGAPVPILDDRAIVFGQLYRSALDLDDRSDCPGAACPEEWAGRPGTRAPHRWVTTPGGYVSTLDLFGHGWVLLARDEVWRDAAARAGEALGIPIDVQVLGVDVLSDGGEDGTATAFGLGDGAASLVRPDGYVGWRSDPHPADPAGDLVAALGHVAAATSGLESVPPGP